jgi:hypothetical protein
MYECESTLDGLRGASPDETERATRFLRWAGSFYPTPLDDQSTHSQLQRRALALLATASPTPPYGRANLPLALRTTRPGGYRHRVSCCY